MSTKETGARFQFGLRHLMAAIAIVAVGIVVVDHARRPGTFCNEARGLLLFVVTSTGPLVYAIQQRRKGKRATDAGIAAGAVTGAVLSIGMGAYAMIGVLLSGYAGLVVASIPMFLALVGGMVVAGMFWGCVLGLCVQLSVRSRDP